MQHGQQHLPASYLELIAGTATDAAWVPSAVVLRGEGKVWLRTPAALHAQQVSCLAWMSDDLSATQCRFVVDMLMPCADITGAANGIHPFATPACRACGQQG